MPVPRRYFRRKSLCDHVVDCERSGWTMGRVRLRDHVVSIGTAGSPSVRRWVGIGISQSPERQPMEWWSWRWPERRSGADESVCSQLAGRYRPAPSRRGCRVWRAGVPVGLASARPRRHAQSAPCAKHELRVHAVPRVVNLGRRRWPCRCRAANPGPSEWRYHESYKRCRQAAAYPLQREGRRSHNLGRCS